MEAKEYTIKSLKKGDTWHNSYGEFQSYALVLSGVGEPVKLNKTIPVNREPQAGDILYGILMEETAADGRGYYRFKAEQKPEDKRDNAAIQAQWAIGQAVACYLAGEINSEAYNNIEREAKHFFAMIDRVKQGDK